MRTALVLGCVATVAAWSFAALAQGTAPSPSAPAAPAPTTPPPESGPVPTEPAPPAPGAEPPTAPPAPPSAPADGAPPPAPAPAPPPPGGTNVAPPPPLPALAAQQPEGKKKPPAAPNESAPMEKRPPNAWQDGHALAIELSGRASARLNAASSSANYEERAGLGIDGALWLTLSSEFVAGLGVKRVDLGEISKTTGANTIDAGYATTAFQLGMRAFPFRSRDWDIFVGLHAGLAWQDVEANGLVQLGTMPDSAEQFTCSAGGGPGFALGAEVGAAFRLSRHLWLTGTVDLNGFRLSSEPVDDCIAGIGAVATVSGGLGLLYAFDLGGGAKLTGDSPKLEGPP